METRLVQPNMFTSYLESWADWFSGFFDGEGTLFASSDSVGQFTPVVGVGIAMAPADADVLESIRHILGVGTICRSSKFNKVYGKRYGQVEWRVRNRRHLANIFIPLFDAHPLRTKKRNEYPIWREAVLLDQRTTPWPDHEIAHMRSLVQQLTDLRHANSAKSVVVGRE